MGKMVDCVISPMRIPSFNRRPIKNGWHGSKRTPWIMFSIDWDAFVWWWVLTTREKAYNHSGPISRLFLFELAHGMATRIYKRRAAGVFNVWHIFDKRAQGPSRIPNMLSLSNHRRGQHMNSRRGRSRRAPGQIAVWWCESLAQSPGAGSSSPTVFYILGRRIVWSALANNWVFWQLFSLRRPFIRSFFVMFWWKKERRRLN